MAAISVINPSRERGGTIVQRPLPWSVHEHIAQVTSPPSRNWNISSQPCSYPIDIFIPQETRKCTLRTHRSGHYHVHAGSGWLATLLALLCPGCLYVGAMLTLPSTMDNHPLGYLCPLHIPIHPGADRQLTQVRHTTQHTHRLGAAPLLLFQGKDERKHACIHKNPGYAACKTENDFC